MVPFLISLVVFCVVAYILYLIVNFIVGHFGLPSPIGQILMAIFGLIILLMFLDAVGLYNSGMSVFRFHK
jgi:hypothetical protein